MSLPMRTGLRLETRFMALMCFSIFGLSFLMSDSAWAKSRDAYVQNSTFISTQPKQRLDYWQKRQNTITELMMNTKDMSDIKLVFIGDSITDFWSLDENPWFPGKYCGLSVWKGTFGDGPAQYRALNLGISGDRLENILFRLMSLKAGGLGELDRPDLNPDYILIMAGINNSFEAETHEVESIVEGVKAIIKSVHERKPHAKIILQSLLPAGDPERDRNVVQPVNVQLAELGRGAEYYKYVTFLNLYPEFVDVNGKPVQTYFNDDLHPSREGYRVWKGVLIAEIDRLRLMDHKSHN